MQLKAHWRTSVSASNILDFINFLLLSPSFFLLLSQRCLDNTRRSNILSYSSVLGYFTFVLQKAKFMWHAFPSLIYFLLQANEERRHGVKHSVNDSPMSPSRLSIDKVEIKNGQAWIVRLPFSLLCLLLPPFVCSFSFEERELEIRGIWTIKLEDDSKLLSDYMKK